MKDLSIKSFALETEELNKKSMKDVLGGINGEYVEVQRYSTAPRTAGGDTDCMDYETVFGTVVVYD